MHARIQWLQGLLKAKEDEHLEFKEARNRYDFEELVKYCAALANEGGGKMVLGVTDRHPRQVVGTAAFESLERTKAGLIEKLGLRIEIEEISHTNGRVLIFHIPSRSLGVPISFRGAYWMRGGDSLVPMTNNQIKRIFAESEPDFSAQLCPGAALTDLETQAIEEFRRRWLQKSQNAALQTISVRQLLIDAELMVDDQLTFAALILLGNRPALGKFLAQAEVVFEYRSSEATGPAQQRLDFRRGFFSFYDDLWNAINTRNDIQHIQDGLFIWDIPTFNEAVVREAVLNAVSHRDYRSAGSVFIKQYPQKLEVVSPGGLPQGITPENILWQQYPRNRRIAEAFARCGLVERAGQGMNRIFEECIRETKPKPDFRGTDAFNVSLTLRCEVREPQFLRFLEKIGREQLKSFATQDFLAIDCIFHDENISEELKDRLPSLSDHGIIEKVGRGRGVRYILSRKFFHFLGKKGVYIRQKGLDRETNKTLLMKHIVENGAEGSKLSDLIDVLPALSKNQIQRLLQELKSEGRARLSGVTKAGRWYPVSAGNNCAENKP
jgi:ATP-dependent DNA helicase RecG